MRISDWSSDVCSSDLCGLYPGDHAGPGARRADDTRQGRREGSLGDPQVEGTLSTLARQSDREALGLYRGRLCLLPVGVPCLRTAWLRIHSATRREEYGARLHACAFGQPRTVVEIGRAHVCTPVTNAHLVCCLLLEQT